MEHPPLALRASACLAGACLFWAAGTVVSKQLLASVPPATLLVLQLAPSAAVLWILVLITRRSGVAPAVAAPVALLGLLNPGLAYTFSMFGLTGTSASVATLLWAAEPALIVVMAWLVLRESVSLRLCGLIACAMGGVVLVTGAGAAGGLGAGAWQGPALILAGVACCAIYTVMAGRVGADADPLLCVTLQQTAGLAWAIAIWPLAREGAPGDAIRNVSAGELAGAVASGVLYYGAAFWLYLTGLRSVPASVAGLYLNLTPLFAVVLAYVFLGERLSTAQLVGAAIILLSVLGLAMTAGAVTSKREAAS